jgi:hypothetical protein
MSAAPFFSRPENEQNRVRKEKRRTLRSASEFPSGSDGVDREVHPVTGDQSCLTSWRR